MLELVLFQTGNMEFALDRECVDNIRPLPDGALRTRRDPQQIIELDDGLQLMINLASGENHCTVPPSASGPKIISVKGTPPYALLADQIKETLKADEKQMDELPPVFTDTARACFPKVFITKNQLALVIDTHALAEYEIDIDAVPGAWHTQHDINEEHQVTPTANRAPAQPPICDPHSPATLDAKVGIILRKIIGQRVAKKVAEVMAQTLETSFW